VIKDGNSSIDINGVGDSDSNTGIYQIQESDINGFTLRCYNKNFGLSTPGAVISQEILPDCEYSAKIYIIKTVRSLSEYNLKFISVLLTCLLFT